MLNPVVFINQTSGYLMVDIINAFHRRGIPCSLIAGTLQLRGSDLSQEIVQHRIIKYSKNNVFTRLASWIISFFQILWIIKLKYRRAHLFLVTNPPLVVFLSYFIKNEMSFLVYDFYPDVLIKNNWQKSDSTISKFWNLSNKRSFHKAKAVFTISKEMQKLLMKRYSLSNVHLIHLWADGEFFKAITKEDNIFIKRHGLDGKFLVVYSGNLGYTHDMDVLVDVAGLIKDPRIFFLIIGNGEKGDLIKNKIRDNQINNCMCLPFQPTDMLPYTIGCADVGVVTLSRVFDGLSIPSKTFTLLSAGKPILCISSADSELATLINSNEIGGCFEPDDLNGMASFILEFAYDYEKQKLYKENAIKTSSLFDKSNADKFVDIFLQ